MKRKTLNNEENLSFPCSVVHSGSEKFHVVQPLVNEYFGPHFTHNFKLGPSTSLKENSGETPRTLTQKMVE